MRESEGIRGEDQGEKAPPPPSPHCTTMSHLLLTTSPRKPPEVGRAVEMGSGVCCGQDRWMGTATGSLALNSKAQVRALSGPKPGNQSLIQGLGKGGGTVRGKRAGDGALAVSALTLSSPAPGTPNLVEFPLHRPSSIPSGQSGRGTLCTPRTPGSFHLILSSCSQHPTMPLATLLGPHWSLFS